MTTQWIWLFGGLVAGFASAWLVAGARAAAQRARAEVAERQLQTHAAELEGLRGQQLTLGVDRDSELVAPLFDERNPAVKRIITMAIQAAKRAGRKIGICGQAPSDYPEFAQFLVEQGIDSLSLNPDSVLTTTAAVLAAERAHRR